MLKLTFLILALLTSCTEYNEDGSLDDPDFVSVNPTPAKQALGTPKLYFTINSNGGAKIAQSGCNVGPGHREFSCQHSAAVRSIAMSRHTGKGKNTYRCAAGNVSGSCAYAFALNTNERIFIDSCRVLGIPPTTTNCAFGTATNLGRVVEGNVNVTPDIALFFFDNGARGEAHFVEDAYWYIPAN